MLAFDSDEDCDYTPVSDTAPVLGKRVGAESSYNEARRRRLESSDVELVKTVAESSATYRTELNAVRGDLTVSSRPVDPAPSHAVEVAPPTFHQPDDTLELTTLPRRSGMPFELHVAHVLNSMAATAPDSTTSSPASDSLSSALRGAVVFAPWAQVPASVLVELGWESRDEHERRRIYEGPADQRGFREYGGDWIAVNDAQTPTRIIVGQDKDHRRLSLGVLGRFDRVGRKAHRFNVKAGHATGTQSAVLCFPSESKISSRDMVELREMRDEYGLNLMSFPDFAPSAERDEEDDGMSEDSDVMVTLDADAVAEPVHPAPSTGLAIGTTTAMMATMDTVVSAALPPGGKERRFQTTAANAIVRDPGIHLVQAPTGCGKTAVVASVIGRLITREHATRAGKQKSAPFIGFITAPYIDHAKQVLKRMEGVLKLQFGAEWESKVVFVADDTVDSVEVLTQRLTSSGARLFVSTDKSASLLFEVAKVAKESGSRILAIKDEAHYNARHESASTRLLLLVDNTVGDIGVACTATPDADVLALPGLKHTLRFPYSEAIRLGFCAPYRIVLPSITGVADGLPVEASELASEDQMGAAALFLVGGMIHDGARRCIAYARDTKETTIAKRFLERACAFHGVECSVEIVVQTTKDRQGIYIRFQTEPTYRRTTNAAGDDGFVITLRFLVAVHILDQCIDLPACDSVGVLSPPTTLSDVKSAHVAIQRLGRALRPKAMAFLYIFSSLENPWLENLFDVLREYDPGCKRRVAVVDTNPITRFTKESTDVVHTELEALVERFHIGSVGAWRPSVDERCRMLVELFPDKAPIRHGEDDRVDVPKRLLPEGVDTYVFRAGQFLNDYLCNFLNDDTAGVGAKKCVLSGDQKQLLRSGLKWLPARVTALKERRAGWTPSIDEKCRLLVELFPVKAPKQQGEDDRVDVPKRLLPEGVDMYVFRAGQFWRSYQYNFLNDDTAGVGAKKCVLSEDQKQLLRSGLKWLPARITALKERRAGRMGWTPTVDEKCRLLVELFPDKAPKWGGEDDRVDVPKRLLPEGVDAYVFHAGMFWGSYQHNFLGDDTAGVGAKKCVLSDDQKQLLRSGLKWLPARVTALKERMAERVGWRPSVDDKVRLLSEMCKNKAPPQGKNGKLDVSKHLLPDGVESYMFDAGQFWNSYQNNFVGDGIGAKGNCKLTEAQKQLLRTTLTWLPERIAALEARRAKRVAKNGCDSDEE